MPTIDKFSRIPIYEQIVLGIEREIATGLLQEGEKLPSVREYSTLLDANPNTVQKALSQLDRTGLVVTQIGRGCFVAEGARKILHQRGLEQLQQLTAIARALSSVGVTRKELQQALDRAFDP